MLRLFHVLKFVTPDTRVMIQTTGSRIAGPIEFNKLAYPIIAAYVNNPVTAVTVYEGALGIQIADAEV